MRYRSCNRLSCDAFLEVRECVKVGADRLHMDQRAAARPNAFVASAVSEHSSGIDAESQTSFGEESVLLRSVRPLEDQLEPCSPITVSPRTLIKDSGQTGASALQCLNTSDKHSVLVVQLYDYCASYCCSAKLVSLERSQSRRTRVKLKGRQRNGTITRLRFTPRIDVSHAYDAQASTSAGAIWMQ